jgi:protein involved in polysaccharide export with SLBB domain
MRPGLLRRLQAGALAVAAVLLLAGVGSSQQDPVIGPGDVLLITVVGEPGLSGSYTVRGDGVLVFPLLGDVPAAGATPKELSSRLAQLLRRYVRDPRVQVSFQHVAPRKLFVYVLGQVARPGQYEYQPGLSLAEVIAQAGGPTLRAALRNCFVIRKNRHIPVDLQALLLRGDANQNVLLEPGDVIVVSQLEDRVHVLGEVARPGVYDLKEGDRLVDVVQKAGWFTPKAGPDRISVIRNDGQQLTLDLVAFLQKGAAEQNIPVLPGDVIYVPETDNRAAVIGEVRKPGSYVVRPGMRVVSLLLDAGGPTEKANLRDVAIVRQVNGKPVVVRANVEQFLREGGEGGLNLEVGPGDVVFVPERAQPFSWQGFFDWLQRLTWFLFLFR